jgi:3-hydroxybutyryl-CoA dehydrogenase
MGSVVGVVGAGTMGAGIAQVAAVAGHTVLLYDAVPAAADRAAARLREQLKALAGEGKLGIDPDKIKIFPVGTLPELAESAVVIEAIVEDLSVKRQLIADLERVVAPDCVLATNTSSLSPTALAANTRHPERIVGMHFFNPVPLMRLVEVVPGLGTSAAVAQFVHELATAWGKTVARSSDTPGFIVNRIARPFYAEAWRLFEERAADPVTIDSVIKGAGGFRMGPFALMDLIGHDVNEAVTRSVWTAFGFDARFAPSPAQRSLVEAGLFGRKTGRGVYDYTAEGDGSQAVAADAFKAPLEVVEFGLPGLRGLLDRAGVAVLEGGGDSATVELPSGALLVRCTGGSATQLSVRHGAPVIVVDRTLDDATATAVAIAASDGCPQRGVGEATGLLQAAGLDVYVVDDAPGLIVTRTVAMLINLAVDALHQGVASREDIDIAMRLGAGHPIGPLEWAQRWGMATVCAILSALQDSYGDPRYRPSPLLRRLASTNGIPA